MSEKFPALSNYGKIVHFINFHSLYFFSDIKKPNTFILFLEYAPNSFRIWSMSWFLIVRKKLEVSENCKKSIFWYISIVVENF